jgi:hypothetical protein
VFLGDRRYSKRNLKGYSIRTCRFCQRSYPEAAFLNYSHLLPQLIGNPNLYSDFECDDCNALFSSFENDLASYLGVARSIVGLQGQKRAPGFLARKMQVKSRSFIGDNILILSPEDVKIDGNTTSITYTKNPYIPSKVYKALLKSALSLLNGKDIKDKYKHALAYLMGRIGMTEGALIGGYNLPFVMNMPIHVFCFQKINSKDKIPDHVICFNFQNRIIIFPIPSDVDNEPSDDWKIIFPPPYFMNQTMMENAHPVPFVQKLLSTHPISDEYETITFQIDPELLENMWCYDPATNEMQQKGFDRSGVKYSGYYKRRRYN